MPDISGEVIGRIMSAVDQARKQATAQFRANMLVSVATLRLLINERLITADKAEQQINETATAFAEVFGDTDVARWTKWATDLLHGDVPLHGSIIDQGIQRKARLDADRPT